VLPGKLNWDEPAVRIGRGAQLWRLLERNFCEIAKEGAQYGGAQAGLVVPWRHSTQRGDRLLEREEDQVGDIDAPETQDVESLSRL
jgi:hypothetical protein